jgi:hypothetical protein
MTTLKAYLADQRIRDAINEFKQRISERFPGTTFDLYVGEDPEGVYLRATVDIDDTDEVIDLVIDQLVTLQVEDELPIHVIPVRTPERRAALYARLRESANWRTA